MDGGRASCASVVAESAEVAVECEPLRTYHLPVRCGVGVVDRVLGAAGADGGASTVQAGPHHASARPPVRRLILMSSVRIVSATC